MEQQAQNERDQQQPVTVETFSARTSFTADSPYYTSYVETEMRQVQVLSQTLQEISARAKTFGKCGALMAEATRRLALACRLKPSSPNNISNNNNNNSNQNNNNNAYDDEDGKSGGDEAIDKVVKERQEAVGEEMMVVLSTLGEVGIDCACLCCEFVGTWYSTRYSFISTISQFSLLKHTFPNKNKGLG